MFPPSMAETSEGKFALSRTLILFHRIGSLNFTLQNRLVGDIPRLVRHGPSKLGPALTRGEN